MTKYFGFLHDDDDYTVYSDDSKIKDIYEYSKAVEYTEKRPLCLFGRDDKSLFIRVLPYRAFQDLEGALEEEAEEITAHLYKRGPWEDNDRVLDLYYSIDQDDFDEEDFEDPEIVASMIKHDLLSIIENSYVDNDSGMVYAIIDLMNNEVLLSGSHDFYYVDSEMLGN